MPEKLSAKDIVLTAILGVGFIALPPFFGWYIAQKDIWFCHEMLSSGVETIAAVDGSHTHFYTTRRGTRTNQVRHSELKYDGFRGEVEFWIDDRSVPIIYPRTDSVPRGGSKVDHHRLLIGRKSDGLVALMSRNYGWFHTIAWCVVSLFFMGCGGVLLGFLARRCIGQFRGEC